MKLELLDAYNIRARLSASIILLAPIAITTFLCFEAVNTLASSTIFVFLLLAFTNYIPLLQRRFLQGKYCYADYAMQLLLPSNSVIDSATKSRYYKKLSKADDSLKNFEQPNESEDFRRCCNSAVSFLKEVTRNNLHVQEENINYGFCKNLICSKIFGIILTSFLIVVVSLYSYMCYESFSSIPINNYSALFLNVVMLLFWIFGITKKMLEKSAIYYAKTLLSKIDILDIKATT